MHHDFPIKKSVNFSHNTPYVSSVIALNKLLILISGFSYDNLFFLPQRAHTQWRCLCGRFFEMSSCNSKRRLPQQLSFSDGDLAAGDISNKVCSKDKLSKSVTFASDSSKPTKGGSRLERCPTPYRTSRRDSQGTAFTFDVSDNREQQGNGDNDQGRPSEKK